MNKIISVLFIAGISLFFSCVPDIEPMPPSPSESSSSHLPLSSSFVGLSSSSVLPQGSSSSGESMKYCVYSEMRQCFSTSQSTCPSGGELSDFCPYISSSSAGPRSSSAVASSSSVATPRSSSSLHQVSSSSVVPSSSSEMVSSSSASPSSSSSVVVSSSSSKPSSSSSAPLSSSSAVSSSSSTVISSSSSKPSSSSSSVQIVYGASVTYQGETYKTVVIGEQTWFQRNLNYAVEDSKCDNDPINCATYGRLYAWAAAMALPANCNYSSCASQIDAKHKGICPSGWHIPSDAEWTTLTDYVGGASTAGTKLRATDMYGFSALPSGYGFLGDDYISNVGSDCGWWSTTEIYTSDAYTRFIFGYDKSVSRNNYAKKRLLSVRCVKD